MDEFYVSNQGKLYKNTQYVTDINKRLFNVAPNKYGKLLCVYDTSPQSYCDSIMYQSFVTAPPSLGPREQRKL